MKRLLKEPLLHFLLLGAALFIAHRLVSGSAGDEPGRIVVSRGQIETMTIGFSRTWQRPPSSEELESLIREHVREEVYYREAMAMGLDRDDTIIRRRLRQKLEFLSDDVTALAEPTDVELAEYLKAHPDLFRIEGRLTFSHVYLSPDKRGDHLDRDAAELLTRLQQEGHADFSALGDPFLLDRRLEAAATAEIATQFGEAFSASLAQAATGQWIGPVESAYGVHLVLIEDRTEGRVPELAEVRDAVHREWTNARRLESNEAFFQKLLERYIVTVENEGSSDAETKVARPE